MRQGDEESHNVHILLTHQPFMFAAIHHRKENHAPIGLPIITDPLEYLDAYPVFLLFEVESKPDEMMLAGSIWKRHMRSQAV